ncbi:MAG TPA: CHRD domain-containing protein [Bacteroidota bacterium]|nr:CHRD domain-containing protein [Bacteroidota bacterium]
MRSFLRICIGLLVVVSTSYGQIFFTAKLDGSQEVPPVTTTASGTGTFILSRDATQLTYNITVNGLSGPITGSHFHNAPAGVAAGVVKSLTFTNNTSSGVWSVGDATQPLTDSLLSELLRGRLYVNIHTGQYPGGEIRGQVLLSGPVTFTARLEGAQEVPPVSTTAAGTGSVTLNPNGTVTWDATVTGLSGAITGSHFHNGAVGATGGVVKSMTFTNNTSAGTWSASDQSQPLTDLLLRELVRGRLYMNVHTAANPGGEIRGQVLLSPGAVFTAKLDGTQEVPAVSTAASGTGTFVLSANASQLSYNITVNGLSGPITGSHFHNAAAGVAGGVVKSLTFTNNTTSGVWSSSDANQPLTDSLLSELLRGRLYVNIHTGQNQGGEIRGQVLLTSVVGFAAKLEGAQEVPPVTTTAAGTGSVRVNTDGTVSWDATVTGLSGAITGSHFHNAATGTAGGVVKSMTFTNNTSTGTWTATDGTQPLTDMLLRELVKGRLYMNVHTAANPGGEIRGQVLSSTGVATSVDRVETPSIPQTFILEQNYPNPFNPTTVIRYSLPGVGARHDVSLRVYNVLGQEVATLVNGLQEGGTYAVQFDARGLSSGMYFYRLSTNSGYSAVKNMMLIK